MTVNTAVGRGQLPLECISRAVLAGRQLAWPALWPLWRLPILLNHADHSFFSFIHSFSPSLQDTKTGEVQRIMKGAPQVRKGMACLAAAPRRPVWLPCPAAPALPSILLLPLAPHACVHSASLGRAAPDLPKHLPFKPHTVPCPLVDFARWWCATRTTRMRLRRSAPKRSLSELLPFKFPSLLVLLAVLDGVCGCWPRSTTTTSA